jgi:fibronectin type 3 domain-containing protein
MVAGAANGIEKKETLTLTVVAEVLLTWAASSSADVIGYNVARSTTSGSGYTRLNSSLIPDLSFTDLTAESGHRYYYVATAVNSAGAESPTSNEAIADVP